MVHSTSWLLQAMALSALACAFIPGEESLKIIEGERFFVPPATHNGSGYTAIECGLDGKIYVGTAMYGGSAHLVRFDPQTQEWKDLIDAHAVTLEKGTGLNSQSKFHAKLLVDADGTIWAATKQGNEDFNNRPEYGEDPEGYPGGLLFSYHPPSGKVGNHGILKKQEGLMGGCVDRKRRRLYYWSDPKQHFLIYDITSRSLRDLGSMGGSPRYMAIDSQGRVFGAGSHGLWMYEPRADRLYDLAVELKGPEPYQAPYAIVASADGLKIFGCALNGLYVMEFDLTTIRMEARDPGTHGTITCRNVTRSIPEPFPPGDQHAGTLGKDGCFYFANLSTGGVHLIRYNPSNERVEDLGVITIKGHQGTKPQHAQGACVGLDGTLYLKFIYDYCIVSFDKLTQPDSATQK